MSKSVQSTSPIMVFDSLGHNRNLILQMTKREVIGRYRGSVMGLFWSLFNPILMLAVYTFVFSIVFQVRWGKTGGATGDFAIILFSGLIVHSLLTECITRAPTLIISNVNYVKRVVFPLEILPWVAMGATLFHTCMSVLVLLFFYLILNLSLQWTVIFLPLTLLPLVILTMGFSWFLASFGVFVQDVSQVIGLISTTLLFLSPVFYPLSSIPEEYRIMLYINPLTFIIEQTRAVLIWGRTPDWAGLGVYTAISMGIAWFGFYWFQKTRKGFADVL